jgi:hypothetical protein
MKDSDRRPASNRRSILKSMSQTSVPQIYVLFQILKSAFNSQIYVLFQILKSASNFQIYGRFSISEIDVQWRHWRMP